MDRKKVMWIALGVGVIGLWWFYRSRKGLSLLPGRSPAAAGPYAQGNGPAPPVLPGPAPAPGTRTINDPDIVAARGTATGPLSRSACSRRWIKTIDGPYYGLCVDDATLARWNSIAGALATTATTAQVKSTLGIR